LEITMRRLLATILFSCLATVPVRAQDQDFFGAGVAFAGDELLVIKRAPARGPAAVHRFRQINGEWQRVGELLAPLAVERGLALASAIVVQGTTLMVGGGDPDDAIGAYVWHQSAQEWRNDSAVAVGPVSVGAAEVTLASIMRVLQPAERSVAASGDLVLVGLSNQAHLFRRQGAGWSRVSLDLGTAPSLGRAVAMGAREGFISIPLASAGRGQVQVIAPNAGGAWRVIDSLVPDGLPASAAFGVSMVLDAQTLVVGASGAASAVVYTRQPTGWVEQQRLAGAANSGFGSALELKGDELLVASSRAGKVTRFLRRGSSWTAAGDLELPSAATPTVVTAMAIGAHHVAVGAPTAVGGRGRVWVFPRRGSGLATPSELGPVPGPASVTAGERPCAQGTSAGFACDQVDLQAFLSIESLGGAAGERVTGIWGWTDAQTNREYALVARTGALVFVDISNPSGPLVVAQMPANRSGARDVKVYRDHAYFVGDGAGNHGMMVFDLTRLRSMRGPMRDVLPDTVYRQLASAHNLAIDTASALAIAVSVNSGGTSCGGGLHLIDIREPKVPKFAGCFTDTEGLIAPGRTHDVQCVKYHGPDRRFHDRSICFASNETALRIVDVTVPSAPVALGRGSYPSAAYIHQGWLTDDQRHFYLNDELDEIAGITERTRTMIWDVSDLEDPVIVGEFLGPDAATDHNLFIRGNRMYLANYQAGFRVVDITNRLEPREIGHFDTTPYQGNAAGFYGAWGSYPFFESGNVVVTSMQEGLFVLRPRNTVVP
jgi:choice-of-anchor B domain-containing protein